MKIGVVQPYLLPYIGYYQLINYVDKYVIFDDVNYAKRGYINRNSMMVNGQPHRFTLSLKKPSSNKLICETTIANNKQDIFDKISYNYKKAPQYKAVIDLMEDIILNTEENLADYLSYQTKQILYFLEIDTEIERSSSLKNNKDLKCQDKIIDICQILKGTTYVNPIGGREKGLYHKQYFEKDNIELQFLELDTRCSTLSIVDILMKNTILEIQQMLKMFTIH